MPGPILPVSSIALPNPGSLAGQAGSEAGASPAFRDVLAGAIRTVEGFSQNASASVERFLSGEGEELHTTILAMERADLAFEMFQQVRNKAVSAYQEIMRMQM